MIIVDSSAWDDYFKGTSTSYVERLEHALEDEEDIGVLPIIVTEVLQGLRSARGFSRARDVMTRLPVLYPDLDSHIRAAILFRRLRSKGITVRGAVDCVIAQICLDSGCMLLSPDADFRLIAQHSRLNLWTPRQGPRVRP